MEEPPINYDYLAEPDAELLSGSEIDPFADAEIESRVDRVEMRDAAVFSARTASTHRADRPGRTSRRNKSTPRPSGKRRNSRPSANTDENEDDDGKSNGLFRRGRPGMLRAGLVLTIVLTILAAFLCIIVFIINSGPKLAPTDVTINSPVINSNYLKLEPPPPAKPTPRVKPTRLHLVK